MEGLVKMSEQNDSQKKILLTTDDILNFEPNIDYKGYAPAEVDKFLDKVISDYMNYNDQIATLVSANQSLKSDFASKDAVIDQAKAKIESLNRQNVSLNNDISLLNQELVSVKQELEDAKKELAEKSATAQAAPVENSFGAGTQVDVLRRIARLEAEVFGKNRI